VNLLAEGEISNAEAFEAQMMVDTLSIQIEEAKAI